MYAHWVGWLMTTIVMSQPFPGCSPSPELPPRPFHPLTIRIVLTNCADPPVSAFLAPSSGAQYSSRRLRSRCSAPLPGPWRRLAKGRTLRVGSRSAFVLVSRPDAEPGTDPGGAIGHPAGSGSGIVGQLQVWSACGAGVKTTSPAKRGPSLARRLDGGEHGRTCRVTFSDHIYLPLDVC